MMENNLGQKLGRPMRVVLYLTLCMFMVALRLAKKLAVILFGP